MGTGSGGFFNSGTSMAAPQVAGVAALNVQAHSTWDAATVAANLINTADPDKVGNYTLPVGGGGLVDVMQSVTNQVTAVGDEYTTENGVLHEASLSFGFVEGTSTWSDTKTVQVTNHGSEAVTLKASAVATEESVGANVTVSSPSVTIPAGGTASVDVTMTVDFTKVPTIDGNDLFSFYESSGHIVFSGDTEIRVPYLAVPRSNSNVALANVPDKINPRAGGVPVTLTNAGGAVEGTADFYALGVKDAEGDVPLAGHPGTDLRAVGVQSWAADDGSDSLLVFAVNTWDRNSNAARNQTEVLIDTNKDGAYDWSVFATDSGLVRAGGANGINEVFMADLVNGGLYAAGYYATSPTDNSTVLLPVWAGDLGLTADKGDFEYSAYVSSLIDSGAYDAMDGRSGYNPWKPSFADYPFATVPVDGSVDVTVELTGNGIGKNKSGGVMVVVLDNAAGEDEALLLEAAVGQGKPAKPGKPEKPGKPAKP